MGGWGRLGGGCWDLDLCSSGCGSEILSEVWSRCDCAGLVVWICGCDQSCGFGFGWNLCFDPCGGRDVLTGENLGRLRVSAAVELRRLRIVACRGTRLLEADLDDSDGPAMCLLYHSCNADEPFRKPLSTACFVDLCLNDPSCMIQSYHCCSRLRLRMGRSPAFSARRSEPRRRSEGIHGVVEGCEVERLGASHRLRSVRFRSCDGSCRAVMLLVLMTIKVARTVEEKLGSEEVKSILDLMLGDEALVPDSKSCIVISRDQAS